MGQNKPLPSESSFKEFSENKASGNSKPPFKKREGSSDRRPSRGRDGGFQSRGRSFGNDRRPSFGGGDREMFDAVCSKCKKPCKVPFKPTTGKPVSCSNCFVKKDSPSGGRSGGFQSRGRDGGFQSRGRSFGNDRRPSFSGGDREMFDAVCSKCKKPCKVPFKPTTGKPVSCSNCFVKKDSPRRDGSGSRGGSRGFSNGGRPSYSGGRR